LSSITSRQLEKVEWPSAGTEGLEIGGSFGYVTFVTASERRVLRSSCGVSSLDCRLRLQCNRKTLSKDTSNSRADKTTRIAPTVLARILLLAVVDVVVEDNLSLFRSRMLPTPLPVSVIALMIEHSCPK
jgi:hypothetical protein